MSFSSLSPHFPRWPTVAALVTLQALLSACRERPAEPEPIQATTAPAASTSAAAPPGVTGGDPLGGKFTLEQATRDLPGKGELLARIATDLGTLECELFADRAPITVANFVGLARGLRPYLLDGKWVTKPAYDGLTFHRIIKGFMLQGGDPEGNGSGEPGYVIPDEIWQGAKHDQRGLLCMANRGKNTNGMQFFITDAAAPHLDGGYTIFGRCGPDEVVEKLASTPTIGERPKSPPRIQSIQIVRAD